MSTRHRLTGPDGATPLGFLTALGAVRLLVHHGRADGLAWEHDGNAWRPVLTAAAATREGLRDDLAAALAAEGRPRFTDLGTSVKVAPETYRAWARSAARESAEPAPRVEAVGERHAAWAACLGSDLSLLGKGTVRPTAWDMTSGQQQFLGMGAELAEAFANGDSVPRLDETLWGPWRGQDPQHPLGWDADKEALYALRATDPSGDKQTSTAGAIRLAFAALPFFPVCVDEQGRLITRGFASVRQESPFTWPLWSDVLDLDTIAGVIALEQLTDPRRNAAALELRGVVAVCRATRAPMGTKGYAIMRPATTLWEALPAVS